MAVEPTLLEMEAVTSVGEKVATTEKEPTMALLTGMSKVARDLKVRVGL